MKTLFTLILIFAFFVFSYNLFGWSNTKLLNSYLLANPYNDKDIVMISDIYGGNVNHFYSSTIDLVTGKCTNTEMNLDYNFDLKLTIINSDKKYVAYCGSGVIHIYNYQNMQKISEISTTLDFSNPNLKLEFSKDGSQIYSLNKEELRFIKYDVLSGTKAVELIINAILYILRCLLNSEKDEFALSINDSLRFGQFQIKKLTELFRL